jgi:lysophospholipase L1-like esterase
MKCIINYLLEKGIIPIIIEIPDYNTEKAFTNHKIHRKILRYVSMAITGTPINCKQKFRNAFDELLNENGYKDKVCVIRYKSWNKEYENDLKRLYLDDGMHLNEEGYEVLDSMIAKTISHHYASKHGLSHDSLR